MAIHTKKIRSESFNRILSGTKHYELRLADWDCQVGDKLILIETDDHNQPTGRQVKKSVTFVEKLKNGPVAKFYSPEEINQYGFQIISIK